jgi:hypothetical protein
LAASENIRYLQQICRNTPNWYEAAPEIEPLGKITYKLLLENCLVFDPILQKYQTLNHYNWDVAWTLELFHSDWFCFFISESLQFNSTEAVWTHKKFDIFGDAIQGQNKCNNSYFKASYIDVKNQKDPHAQWFTEKCSNNIKAYYNTKALDVTKPIYCHTLDTTIIYSPKTCYWDYDYSKVAIRQQYEYVVVDNLRDPSEI